MKFRIGFVLASGLALCLAGCASSGPAAAPAPGTAPTTAYGSVRRGNVKDFTLAVKCPGVHYEKTHGWTDDQIMAQEGIEPDQIGQCEQWVINQPKGYVPPPPPGYVPRTGGPGAAPAATPPAGQQSSASAPAPTTP
jgi:hypothetical protein